jgi:AraC-like DNA-binding protein
MHAPSPPTHFATQLSGVSLFEERQSEHYYRVWHEDWFAFCVVQGGAAEIRYRYRCLPLEPNTVLSFMPGEAHETRRILVPGTYSVLMFPAQEVLARAQELGRVGLQLAAKAWVEPRLVAAFQEFCTLLRSETATLLERQLLYAALLDLVLAQDERAPAVSEDGCETGCLETTEQRVIRRVRDYLVAEPIQAKTTLADIVSALGLSPSYAARVFSSNNHCPPKTLLRLVRVERARQLLLDPNNSVKFAAFSAGFSSAEKLNHSFRVVWNMSPTDYRARHTACAV